jgi:hypothetical protein
MTAIVSPTPKPNALFLQAEETKRLQAEFDAVNRTYFEMSQMRNRTTIKNRIDVKGHADFVRGIKTYLSKAST